MATREEVHAAYLAATEAFWRVMALEPVKWHPKYANAYIAALAEQKAKDREWERLVDELPPDPIPAPDLREYTEDDAALWREHREKDGKWDAEERFGGTRPNL